MDSADNSNDDNDLEVATVLAGALKENVFCQSLSTHSNPNPPRSSTVLTNLPRGNSVNLSQSNDISTSSIYELAAKGELSVIKRLFLQHREFEKQDPIGKLPLLAAARNNWPHVVEFLLEEGVDVDAAGEELTTALHQASAEGHGRIVEILLQHNPNINLRCLKGNTALHYAIHSKDSDCIKLLLQAGADVTIANNDGITSIEFAYKRNCRHVERIFQKHLLGLFED